LPTYESLFIHDKTINPEGYTLPHRRLAANVAVGSVATEPFSDRSDLCPLLPHRATIRGLGLEGREGPGATAIERRRVRWLSKANGECNSQSCRI
jgi:hypothetical protein